MSQWVVLLLAMAIFINMVDRGNLATAAPVLRDELALSNSQMGVLLSAFFWVYAPALPLAGWMAHRFDVRIVLAGGLMVWSVATVLTGFAAGFASLLIARLLLGLGESASYPCTMRLIAQYLPDDQRGRASGLIGTGQALGPSIGTLFGGLLIAGFGWRVVFIGLGLASLSWLIPWYIATRRGVVAEMEDIVHVPASWSQLLRQRGLWGTSVGLFCLNYGYYFVLSWLPLILVKSRGFSVQQMAFVGAAVYGVHALFCAALGTMSDSLIRRGASTNRVRKTFIAVGSLGSAATIGLTANADPHSTIWLLCLYGFFAGFTTPMIFAITQTFAGARAAGQWYGVQAIAGQAAGIIAPIVTGMIVDRTGQFAWAFVTAAAVLLLGAFAWGLIVPRIEPIVWSDGLASLTET